MYMVQTVTGMLDVGSRAVFWQQPLGTSGNQLAVLRPEPLQLGKKVAYCLVGVSRTNQPADLAKLERLAAASGTCDHPN